MTRWFVGCVLGACSLVLLGAKPVWSQGADPLPIRILSYELEVSPDYSPGSTEAPILNTLTGLARIQFANAGTEPLARLPILVNRLMRITEIRDAEDRALEYSERLVRIRGWEKFQVTEAIATLEPPLAPGATTVISVEYGGQLAPSTETGMLYVRESLDPGFSIFRVETFAFPVVSWPDATEKSPLNLGPAFLQTITLDLPENMEAANGGRRVLDETVDDRRKIRFRTTEPSDVMTFTVAPYESAEVGDARFFFFPEDADGARRLMAAAEAAFDFFEELFGPRRRTGDGVAFIEIPPGYGSQAVLPTIIQTAAAFRDPEQSYEMFHEIGHLWNVRDLDEPSPRWNEGLSTFLQHYADERLRKPGSYATAMERLFSRVKGRIGDETHCAGLGAFGTENVMRGQSYVLGGLFFARLHHLFGDRFFAAYGDFYQQYKAEGATTQTFVDHLVQGLGSGSEAEIGRWFDGCDYLELIRQADDFEDFLTLRPDG